MTDTTITEVIELAEQHGVTPNGFITGPKDRADKAKWPAHSRVHLAEIERARRFLKGLPTRQTLNRREGSTYGLKHVAERWAGDYISNGAFILACYLEG